MTTSDIIDAIIRREGGYVDHPADKGGPTKYGITQETLYGFFGRGDAEDVYDLSESDARRIYERVYIGRPGFDSIADDRLRELVVDSGVNHGTDRATRWLQRSAGAKVDGVFGPRSTAAVVAADASEVYKKVLSSRCRFYGNLISNDHSQAVFAAGWAWRMSEFIEKAA